MSSSAAWRCGSGRRCGIGSVFKRNSAMRTLRWMVGLSCLTLALGCNDSHPAATPVAQAATPAPITAATDAASEFQVTGPIVVENQVDVAAERDGVVARLYVDIGTPVRKGQVLGE